MFFLYFIITGEVSNEIIIKEITFCSERAKKKKLNKYITKLILFLYHSMHTKRKKRNDKSFFSC